MIGAWDKIGNDLTTVSDMVKGQSGQGRRRFQTTSQNKIVSKWNALATGGKHHDTTHVRPTYQGLNKRQ